MNGNTNEDMLEAAYNIPNAVAVWFSSTTYGIKDQTTVCAAADVPAKTIPNIGDIVDVVHKRCDRNIRRPDRKTIDFRFPYLSAKYPITGEITAAIQSGIDITALTVSGSSPYHLA
jgi:hypothetical protein